jgi:protein-S-isoprenylcysteine O-methyltransferase Ste14
MQALELKIPPPVVALLMAAAMWGIRLTTPPVDIPMVVRAGIASAFAVAGIGIALWGVIAFRRARTTVNPLKPESASSLVTSGVYRFTRNPMYVGMGLVLIAWAFLLSSAMALLGPVVFVLYMNRFQIEPEERALAIRFGDAFLNYRATVRRWL